MFMLGFPLLLIPFAIYNIIAFLMPGVSWTGTIATVRMVSDADWTMSAGDILVAFAIVLLCGEIIKSTRIGIRTVVDHALSLILFLGMLIEFGPAGTPPTALTSGTRSRSFLASARCCCRAHSFHPLPQPLTAAPRPTPPGQ